ncbi:small multi-drug export protein [Oscillibacter ruminantium]
MRAFPWWRAKIDSLEKHAHLKGGVVHKYPTLGLLILVAIPLPGTGAWTGVLVASILDIRLKTAVPTIFAGVIIAGILTMLLTFAVGSLFGL